MKISFPSSLDLQLPFGVEPQLEAIEPGEREPRTLDEVPRLRPLQKPGRWVFCWNEALNIEYSLLLRILIL